MKKYIMFKSMLWTKPIRSEYIYCCRMSVLAKKASPMWFVTQQWTKAAAHTVSHLCLDGYSQAPETVVIIISLQSFTVIGSFWLETLSGRGTLEAELMLPEPQPLTVGKKANRLRWREETESRRRTWQRSSAPRTRALWEQEPNPL